MPNYRRAYVPGGTVFLTVVTYRRAPILDGPANVARLRQALGQVMCETPFRIPAAVVLPDHAHFLWSLPRGDADYSRRVGRMKVLFTRSLQGRGVASVGTSRSRHRHRESDVWQRRFWEHTVESEEEFEALMEYIHYNPVRHGLTSCPHLWPYSSFDRWVQAGLYPKHWGCSCDGRTPVLKPNQQVEEIAGE
ncbi:REP-associated tyrosine transposase [Paludisphaera soli]|uniref:REP-associated tyrosine transposase n=1 Tax=Paludisphaera soli TaxID=2712865 RepID=UPI0013ECB2A4|nr:transposase [Paludisphaera soli]